VRNRARPKFADINFTWVPRKANAVAGRTCEHPTWAAEAQAETFDWPSPENEEQRALVES
jgi:hypothetical protein